MSGTVQNWGLLILLLVANGSPIIVRSLLGDRLRARIDAGVSLGDGHALFGESKTIVGAAVAVCTTTLLAAALGFGWTIGLLIGTLAMLGDLVSSFVKRRIGLRSSAAAPGLDQIPESLLPMLAVKPLLALSLTQVALLSLGFMLADLLISRLLYRLGFRQHPY
jgi:CDP-2,3-bis-(O-geranylgeranyl)-sn-glycerol synthase